MRPRDRTNARGALLIVAVALSICACGGGGTSPSGSTTPSTALVAPNAVGVTVTVTATPKATASTPAGSTGLQRSQFVGAFFRPQGSPPYGVFSTLSPGYAPNPYPSPGGAFLGPSGYCTKIATNGYSIETGNVVDQVKLNDILALGVRWVRMPASQFLDDLSHVFGATAYQFGDLDSAQCSTLAEHNIKQVIGLEAGPVQYSAVLGQLPAVLQPIYQSATDFGTWCGVVAAHERNAFPSVTQFSLPGNEVNSNSGLFPGGNTQIAAYSEACYAAVKAANPSAFVYGFELNMDGNLNAPGFVQQMASLGCKVGTCYDGISMHLSLRYPIPSSSTPCYPNAGGDYGMQCITDIQTAAGSAIHVLISETVYPVPGYVPDEATKAAAVAAEFSAFATNASVDGVAYANVDECGLYPSGFFFDGCLISTTNQILPAYTTLQQLAESLFQ